ncbi:MAG: transglutaminase [Hyphomicrobiales bacterium]|nr:MAG: transglutaminase [Hyphomicrobiales bacterium]
MKKRLIGLAALLAGLCLSATGSVAGDHRSGHQPLTFKGSTKTPIGARQFCSERPDECRPVDAAHGSVVLTDAMRRDLRDINNRWNRDVVAVTDQDYYRKREFWTYPDGFGDCEDFALAKRRTLIERGWPAAALRMALVRQRNGEAHAVLVAITNVGDFVLDNLVGDILDWAQTDYKFVKMQSPQSLGNWVDVADDRVIWVASK